MQHADGDAGWRMGCHVSGLDLDPKTQTHRCAHSMSEWVRVRVKVNVRLGLRVRVRPGFNSGSIGSYTGVERNA